MIELAKNILEKIRVILPDKSKVYALHEPFFQGNESQYVQDCITTGWVSSVGSYVDEFEEKLKNYTGAQYAIATVNGTSALHVALLVSGIQSGDEMLVPALTFVATANAVSFCGAIPHFVDADLRDFGVSADKLADYLYGIAEVREDACYNKTSGRKIHGLCVTHIFGHPSDLNSLIALCDQYKLKLIEDAAEGLGSFYQGHHVGTQSIISALSFNGNKIITTGGGGAILTSDERLAKKAKHLSTTARLQHNWQFMHDEIGYNYRMPNINAALGCAQLEKLDEFLDKKRKLSEKYLRIFSDFEACYCYSEPENARSNYWLNALILKQSNLELRDKILSCLHENNIMARPIWHLMHKLPMYIDHPKMDLSNAENLFGQIVLLPSSPQLTES